MKNEESSQATAVMRSNQIQALCAPSFPSVAALATTQCLFVVFRRSSDDHICNRKCKKKKKKKQRSQHLYLLLDIKPVCKGEQKKKKKKTSPYANPLGGYERKGNTSHRVRDPIIEEGTPGHVASSFALGKEQEASNLCGILVALALLVRAPAINSRLTGR